MDTNVLNLNLIQHVFVVLRGRSRTAQPQQHPQPLRGEGITARSHFGAQYCQIVQSLVVVDAIAVGVFTAHPNDGVANKRIPVIAALVQLFRPGTLDPPHSPGTLEYLLHERRVVDASAAGGLQHQTAVQSLLDLRIGVPEGFDGVRLGLEQATRGVEVVEVRQDATLRGTTVARVRYVFNDFAKAFEDRRGLFW